ncbi:hypothetical protein DM01DRAFT_1326747 [Hesseltinella vesiculosa]|uniref:Arrestin C-terminal-like domain-containing protein n=1 Tax=Hesseltinella vesiculosa TaxID=101127 RepID=A0A1X2G8B0_9FUNG|nr:hypothetical protein DM01DRAFT_1326747 [Hesseltinella vesiculosa]
MVVGMKTAEVQIELPDDTVLLVGHPEEAGGKVLKGKLRLTSSEPIKVRSVCLHFVGKMKVSWSEGIGHHQHYYKQEKPLVKESWQFIPVPAMIQSVGSALHKKSYTLAAGEHVFDFELSLPGDLPQTLEAEDAQISYRFKAVVERPAFVHNLVKKLPIKVVRSMLPSEFDLYQSLEISNTWESKMQYDITMSSKMYALGETIRLTFSILPIAPQLKVRSICASLKEYCSYTTSSNSKTDTRIIKFEKILDPFSETDVGRWTREMQLQLPDNSPLVFCNTDNEMIHIRHKLKFSIALINADSHMSELRCSIPVVVIDSVARQMENMLPRYDDTWRSVPYHPSVFEALRRPSITAAGLPHAATTQPVTISGRSRTLSITTLSASPCQQANGDRDASLSGSFNAPSWWQGMDLSRVPSYNTAAPMSHVDLSSSLPAYDQVCSSPSNKAQAS